MTAPFAGQTSAPTSGSMSPRASGSTVGSVELRDEQQPVCSQSQAPTQSQSRLSQAQASCEAVPCAELATRIRTSVIPHNSARAIDARRMRRDMPVDRRKSLATRSACETGNASARDFRVDADDTSRPPRVLGSRRASIDLRHERGRAPERMRARRDVAEGRDYNLSPTRHRTSAFSTNTDANIAVLVEIAPVSREQVLLAGDEDEPTRLAASRACSHQLVRARLVDVTELAPAGPGIRLVDAPEARSGQCPVNASGCASNLRLQPSEQKRWTRPRCSLRSGVSRATAISHTGQSGCCSSVSGCSATGVFDSASVPRGSSSGAVCFAMPASRSGSDSDDVNDLGSAANRVRHVSQQNQ